MVELDCYEQWNDFLASGRYDNIEKPDEGYQIGDPVTDRGGIFYLVKAIKTDGSITLALDREADGKEKTVPPDDIRLSGHVMHELIASGIVEVPEGRLVELTPLKTYSSARVKNN